ncbi:MAG: SUMF1/EgtB/PvdO family nonheme iron enzyme, partial [Bacteroidota bacterium]
MIHVLNDSFPVWWKADVLIQFPPIHSTMMNIFFFLSLFSLGFATPSPSARTMAEVKPNLYVDRWEVRNIDWQEFEHHLIQTGENLDLYRNREVWKADIYNQTYHLHAAFRNYPAVGITRFGAAEFCKWRNTQVAVAGYFRLPSSEEYLYAMTEGENSEKYAHRKKRYERKWGEGKARHFRS